MLFTVCCGSGPKEKVRAREMRDNPDNEGTVIGITDFTSS